MPHYNLFTSHFLLKAWNRINYVNDDIMDVFKMIFKWEDDRADIEQIKKCSWLKDKERIECIM